MFCVQCVSKLLNRTELRKWFTVVRVCANINVTVYSLLLLIQVELLLEGLQGAEMCDTYHFHVERGYGTQYFTQVHIFVCL